MHTQKGYRDEGKFVIVVDDEDRENEGDLIIAAEKIDAEKVNFMLKLQSRYLNLKLFCQISVTATLFPFPVTINH